MRNIMLAVIVTLGVGLIGAPGAYAAPANGAAISAAAGASNLVEEAQWRRRHRRCRSVRVCRGAGPFRRCWYERRCW